MHNAKKSIKPEGNAAPRRSEDADAVLGVEPEEYIVALVG